MSNTATNVTFGKPQIGGAVFTAPLGTTLPTDAVTSLGSAFTPLGYCSNDGLTNANSPSSSSYKAWGGDNVLTMDEGKEDTFKLKLIEALNTDVLKVVYGDSNVSGTLSSGITVRVNNDPQKARIYVVDMLLRDNTVKRVVIPNATISAMSDIVYKDNDVVGYDITLTAMPGDSSFGFDTHKEYIKKVTGATGST